MPKIEYEATQTTCTLWLSGISNNWNPALNGQRTVSWYIAENKNASPTNYDKSMYVDIEETYIDDVNSFKDAGHYKFKNLKPGTKYGVYYRIEANNKVLGEGKGTFYTDEEGKWITNLLERASVDSGYSTILESTEEYTAYVFALIFAKSGYVKFCTFGDVDTIGYLAEANDTEFNDVLGYPNPHLKHNDDSGEGANFKFEYKVKKDVEYYLYVREASGKASNSEILVFVETVSDQIVTKWDWFSTNSTASGEAEATGEQTIDAYDAILYGQPTTNFHHKVWNDIVKKVNEIMGHSYGSWDGTYTSYSKTLMNSEPYELKASMFNAVRNNLDLAGDALGLGYQTGLNEVYEGDSVLGWYFTKLTEYMNDCIDVINSS